MLHISVTDLTGKAVFPNYRSASLVFSKISYFKKALWLLKMAPKIYEDLPLAVAI